MNATNARNELLAVVGADSATFYPDHNPDDLHDESLHRTHVEPFAVVRPSSTEEVSAIAKIASRHGLAMTARGSGTGLSGGATPVAGGIVISFERMNRVVRLDTNDHVVSCSPD